MDTSVYSKKGFIEDNYIYICELAKIALITPVMSYYGQKEVQVL